MKVVKKYKIVGDQDTGDRIDRELFKIGFLTVMSSEPLYESPENICVISPQRQSRKDVGWIQKNYLIPHPESKHMFVQCNIFFQEPYEKPRTSEYFPTLTIQYFEESGLPQELENILDNSELEDI